MIPIFVTSGARVIAPDWLGFGRSDKSVEDPVYMFNFHRNLMLAFLHALDLRRITLVVQCRGGLLGLTPPLEMSERLERLLVMNTGLAVEVLPGPGFEAWKGFNRSQTHLDIPALMSRAGPILTREECAAYAAPFPDLTYKSGLRRFQELVMVSPDMEGVDISKRAAGWWSTEWRGQSYMAIGEADSILGVPAMKALRRLIANCPEPMLIREAGRFVQEWVSRSRRRV